MVSRENAYARASWKLFSVISTSASGLPRYSSTLACEMDEYDNYDFWEFRTINGAFGIPLGFFSSENTGLNVEAMVN